MIFIKLSIFILCIFLVVIIACYLITKNKKYISIAKATINYLFTILIMIAIIYFSLRYFRL